MLSPGREKLASTPKALIHFPQRPFLSLSSTSLYQADKTGREATSILYASYDTADENYLPWYGATFLHLIFMDENFASSDTYKIPHLPLRGFCVQTSAPPPHVSSWSSQLRPIWIILLSSWQWESQWNSFSCCWVTANILKTSPLKAAASRPAIGWLGILCSADTWRLAEEWQLGIATQIYYWPDGPLEGKTISRLSDNYNIPC